MVLLPLPLEPTSATVCPAGMRMLKSRNTGWSGRACTTHASEAPSRVSSRTPGVGRQEGSQGTWQGQCTACGTVGDGSPRRGALRGA